MDAAMKPKVLMPKVLMLSPVYPPHHKGGLGVQAEELAKGLVRAGATVRVVSFTSGRNEDLERDGVTIHFRAPQATRATHSADEVSQQIEELTRSIAEEFSALAASGDFLPDLVHTQDWLFYDVAVRLRERFGLPVVGSVHLVDEPIQRWWGVEPDPLNVRREAEYLTGVDAVLAVSQGLADIIRETHGLGERLHVVHNGVDTELFKKDTLPPPVKAKLRATMAKPDEKIVLFAGRISPVKGLEALVESAAEVVRRRPGVRYLVAGEAVSRASDQRMKGLLEAHPELGGSMKLLGRITRKKLSFLYQVADLALVTSLYDSFPYAVTEALACGRPVVATRTGGIPEILTHGKNGLLVPVHVEGLRRRVDVEALIEAQLELLDHPERAERLALAGYAHATEKLTFERMVEGTLGVYRAAMAAAAAAC